MVSSCCICSKENVPSEPYRSFHRIPANEEMRNKWFEKIGRIVSYKGARVCSDHFIENDYHDINPYSRIKRLKNTAVPSMILRKEKNIKKTSLVQKTAVDLYNNSEIIFQNENDITLDNSENLETNASNDIESNESEDASNELMLTQDTNENLIIFLNSEEEINVTCIDNEEKIDSNFENNNDLSGERQCPSSNLKNSEMKILKLSRHNTVCFTKADFLSDEKWTEFLKCITYNERENRLMQQKNKSLQKKISVLQDIVQDLLSKKKES
ncbi:PREDICTED: uncharacterized protein LOC105457067 isoform X1 [Wasmannia auropunctata]|uniref:uncharacterized protein LOC105457067 isoform X1 n=2 Tax=Wasmannia auropunctata TaxID=64793 RepID=UPI0005EEE3E9|nr:PREDICTED: uncharacterized protein LOC105457067 isoform X1 [Wasmannia auropunctata]